MQPFRTILFAADFSENSKEAFEMACKLAVKDKTRLLRFTSQNLCGHRMNRSTWASKPFSSMLASGTSLVTRL